MTESVEVPISRGMVALVDDQDLELVSRYSWTAKLDHLVWYATTHARHSDNRRYVLLMHRLILPGVARIDHRNGNGLDNRRENLRPCTVRQNTRNQRPHTNSSSRFLGVCWHKRDGVWQAAIKPDGKNIHLGSFRSETDAARAYDVAASRYYGEFARLNFPPTEPTQ